MIEGKAEDKKTPINEMSSQIHIGEFLSQAVPFEIIFSSLQNNRLNNKRDSHAATHSNGQDTHLWGCPVISLIT